MVAVGVPAFCGSAGVVRGSTARRTDAGVLLSDFEDDADLVCMPALRAARYSMALNAASVSFSVGTAEWVRTTSARSCTFASSVAVGGIPDVACRCG